MKLINNIMHAKRLALSIIGGIYDYDRELVIQAINSDDFFEVMKDCIEEGREHFNSRVSEEIAASNFFDIAICDILIRRVYRERTTDD